MNDAIESALSLRAIAELSTMRMELYEYQLNPIGFERLANQGVAIFKTFEKIYKSLNDGIGREFKSVKMRGGSYSAYSTKRIVNLGFFIILENAWKYSMPNKDVDIEFHESGNTLSVSILNWGPELAADEQAKIKERGFRGKEAKNYSTKGKGLGLEIADRIFNVCGVGFHISFPDSENVITYEGIRYSQFMVTLTFSPVFVPYKFAQKH